MAKLKRFALSLLGLLLLSNLLALPQMSAAATGATVGGVAQGYASSGNLQNGMIVELMPHQSGSVEALTANNINQMFGVVVPPSSAPVTISGGSSGSQVFVATNGQYDVLVSNQNGPIKVGDYITISSLSGIGMKADDSSSIVLGKAAAAFNGNNNVEGSDTLKAKNGGNVTVSITSLPVYIGITHNPLAGPVNGVPGFLKGAANILTNQAVPAVRLYIAFGIFLVTALITASVLFSGVRSAMVAVGRNPLAKSRIMSSLLRVILSSAVIFIIGIGAVYLVLKV